MVLGYIVRGPLAGMVWSNLQYLQGLDRLGHDVYFLEDSDDYPCCWDPRRSEIGTDPSYGLEFAKQVFRGIGLDERWAYYDAHAARWEGPAGERMLRICAEADLLLDLCGVNPLRPWVREIPIRALVDEDPAFTQIRNLSDAAVCNRVRDHTTFFTFGEGIPDGTSLVPEDGFPWQATRQPVVLDRIAVRGGRADGRFSTLMSWESYPAREWGGARYGMKGEAFMPYLDLPRAVGPVLEIALGGAKAPRELLTQHGWIVTDPGIPSQDPVSYASFLERSKAEWSVAKHGYVASRCGWFSERSAAYMATGRPVVVQDTGFSRRLPTGAGLVPFTSPEEAAAGISEVTARYDFHCRSAREIAEQYFDSRRILTELIEECTRSARDAVTRR